MTYPSRTERAAQVLLIAAWSALVTGVVHVLLLIVRWRVFDRFVWYSPEFVWMTPLSYLIFFAAPAIILAVIAFIAPRLVPIRLAVFGFVTIGVFALLLPFTQIARIAALLLSAGVAVQVARMIGGSPEAWLPRLRRSAMALVALVVALGVGGRVGRKVLEQRAVAALPAAPSGVPNVLVIILDTVRAASFSLYGYERETTPNLARWAAEGATFEQAFATAPWTLPSHATMFTGYYGGELTADWEEPFDGSRPTLAERFRERGYATGGFVANDDYTAYDSGLSRGFIRFEDYLVSLTEILYSSSLGQTNWLNETIGAKRLDRKLANFLDPNLWITPKHINDRITAPEISRRFLDWQAGVGDRPFFAFLNYFDAHGPYNPPAPFNTRFTGPIRQLNLYDGAIAYLDVQLDSVFTELARRGVLDNTVVVVTSDHGELFGEHDLWGHAHNVYLPVLHVPLVIRYPGAVPAGFRSDRVVSLRDLAATLSDLARVEGEARFPGTSLATLWRADSAAAAVPTSPALSEVSRAPNVEANNPTNRGPLTSIVVDGVHYMRNADGVEEAYLYASDPLEAQNVVADPAHAAAVGRARATVSAILAERAGRPLVARPAPGTPGARPDAPDVPNAPAGGPRPIAGERGARGAAPGAPPVSHP
jgi:arylsulfatase A-like enzyme